MHLVLLIVFKIEAHLSLLLEDGLRNVIVDLCLLLVDEGFVIEGILFRVMRPRVSLVVQRSVLIPRNDGL